MPHTHTKIQVIMQSHLPPPSFKTMWNQLSSSLYLPGVAWVASLTVMLIQRIDKCNAPEESGPKNKEKHVYSLPISSWRISTPEKTISSLHFMIANTSWISIWNATLGTNWFSSRNVKSIPSKAWGVLRRWPPDTLLGPSTWLLHLNFPFQNFKRISRHWSQHRCWFISWSCGFMVMVLKLSIRSPGKPEKDTSSFSPTSTSLVPTFFLSYQGDFDTHQSLRTTTVSH